MLQLIVSFHFLIFPLFLIAVDQWSLLFLPLVTIFPLNKLKVIKLPLLQWFNCYCWLLFIIHLLIFQYHLLQSNCNTIAINFCTKLAWWLTLIANCKWELRCSRVEVKPSLGVIESICLFKHLLLRFWWFLVFLGFTGILEID